MEKVQIFFEKVDLLNKKQFNELINHVSINVSLPSDKRQRVHLHLKYNSIIPIEIFKALYENVLIHKNDLLMKFDNKINIDLDKFIDYLKFWLDKQQITNNTLTFILTRKPFNILDSGLVIIDYFNKLEKDELKKIETNFINWMQSIGLNIVGFDFQIDEERQDLQIYKLKQTDILKSQPIIKPSNNNLKKAIDINQINSNDILNIKEISPDMKDAVIIGEVFLNELRVFKNNNRRFFISVCDHTSAIVVSAFPSVTPYRNYFLPENYLSSFVKGDWIKAEIELMVDKNETIGKIKKIIKINQPSKFIREDKSQKPRIELLAHTKMSSFDGIVSSNDLVLRTKKYNWPAIAIADRHNVQAYPEIVGSAKKNNQKIIYGTECDLLDDQIEIVKNPIDAHIDKATYVVFDIETTGLVNEYDEIIEFGGVKIQNGNIVDRIDFFIKPKNEIPTHITQMTRISNQMVEDASPILTSLKKIINWIGDGVLVAHNGINFDLRFINKKLEQNNLPLITNCLIDTMQISKAINKHLSYHRLGVIARDYKINYDDTIAHRADFDAEVLYEVWMMMLHKLKEIEINNINQINTSLQNSNLLSKQFNEYVEIYAKKQSSIKSIYKIVSTSLTKHLYNNPRVFKKELVDLRNDFIVTNSPTEGEIWDKALNGTQQELDEAINFYDYVFISPPSTFAHEINRKNISRKHVEKTIEKIIEACNKKNKKVIAVSDAYYLDMSDQIAHSVFVNSKLLGGKRHRLFNRSEGGNDVLPDLHLRTTQEMLEEFNFLNDQELIQKIVIDNTYEFSNQIENDIQPLKHGLYTPKIDGVEEKLKQKIYENAKKIYGANIHERIKDRIEKELKAIMDNNYSVIYWICHLLLQKSIDDKNIVGSRGSVGSSIIAFLTQISEVNPLAPHYLCDKCKYISFDVNKGDGFDLPDKNCPHCNTKMIANGHDIPFETFLGYESDSKIPDIDLNFSRDYQSKAHDFIREMFGKDHTIRAGTISTIAEKTAFGYVKNYFETIDPTTTQSRAWINWIVKKCTDVKRTTGQHPGGMIIIPKEYDVLDFMPYNFPADQIKDDEGNFNDYTSHFDAEKIHDNLLKLDILGHVDPMALMMLERILGIDVRTIPMNDEKVIKVFTSLEPLNIKHQDYLDEKTGAISLPEFGTEFVRQLLTDAQPKSFEDLVGISGLSHGRDVWLNNAKNLIVDAKKTLSDVITCRDNIMAYLIKNNINTKTAFYVMESVRKGKGIKESDVKKLKEKGIEEWYIDSCNKIKYLFPKAHATAYVINAYRFAWFKVYYPIHYYSTYFSLRADTFDLSTIVSGPINLKQKIEDIKIRKKDPLTKHTIKNRELALLTIYEVALEFYARGYKFKMVDLKKSQSDKFVIEDNYLIPSFTSVDGMGLKMAESIVEARNQSHFVSKDDLLTRTKISSKILTTMEELNITSDLAVDGQTTLF